MTQTFWIILLIILLAITIFVSLGIVFYHRIVYRYKNGLVARIHMADSTIQSYRYNIIPPDNIISIKELNDKGEETTFVYTIKEECIEKGNWGKYIDYDYHVTTPINPKNRSSTPLLNELKEMFKLVGALLDTDLHVKLLRSSKFEDFVRLMLIILMFMTAGLMLVSGYGIYATYSQTPDNNFCSLQLDNETWKTIYIASNEPPPTLVPTGQGARR